jgi:hypothetical protein
VKTLFKYRSWEQGEDVDWDPVITYSDNSGTDNPRDYLSRDERRKIREASLEHGSIPHYNSLTPAVTADGRSAWRRSNRRKRNRKSWNVSRNWKRREYWRSWSNWRVSFRSPV